MTKDEVIEKIKAILAKDKKYKDVVVKVDFIDKKTRKLN